MRIRWTVEAHVAVQERSGPGSRHGLLESKSFIKNKSVCGLLVLDSVTSTPQGIRQPKSRDVHDVCVFVRKCVLGSPRASQSLNILAYSFSSTLAFSLRCMSLRLAVGDTQFFQAPALLHSRPSPPPNGSRFLTYLLHLGLHYIHLT